MNLVIDDGNVNGSANIDNASPVIDMNISYGSTNDYNSLKNIPKLDGREIKGEINELDPTVPGWAKADSKPSYTAEEINAVDADDVISLEFLAGLFK